MAGKTVQYMFYDLFKDYTELKAEVLGSSCFINDGKGILQGLICLMNCNWPRYCHLQKPEPGNFIAGGNFYGTIPYEGRYDALLPAKFSFDNGNKLFTTGSIFRILMVK